VETLNSDVIEISARLPRALVESVILEAARRPSDPASGRLALAKWIVVSRRRRAKIFKDLRLGEPTWDMILELYVAECEGHRVDVSGLCLASGVPPTTALRYVDLLFREGHIAKVDDRDDGRRAFVNMQADMRAAVDDWLDQAEAGLRVAGWAPRPHDPTPIEEDDAHRTGSG
jgi:hypothetical protein